MEENKIKGFKNFKLSSWALKNRNTVYLITAAAILFGMLSYKGLPKELFPDIATPYVMVNTVYFGNPPVDIENLITRPIEKELESLKGVKQIESTSAQDASMIFITFNSNIQVEDVIQDVKDAVDKAKSELPNDLTADPLVTEIDFSEFPIQNINLAGDYSIEELKKFAELIQDQVESISEVSKVLIVGVNEKEIKINVDPLKLESFELSFNDIENAIAFENMNMSGGEIKIGGTRQALRVVGEFTSIDQIEKIIVKNENTNVVYLNEVADVIYGFEEITSITRLDGKPVVSLQVVKKSGENLLSATAQIETILDEIIESNVLPEGLEISITNDQSEMIKMQLRNLENSMVISILFVVLVLFFFLGTRNALFVGLAIPLSMLLSFSILNLLGYKINMIVLFSLILALGMLVDNAIVVVENTARFIQLGYKNLEAARLAVSEVAVPIIASTATTLAAFFPLLFWQDMVGEFMKILPITLIIVLSSSLFVALVIIPVIASRFSKKDAHKEPPSKKIAWIVVSLGVGFGVLAYVLGLNKIGTLMMLVAMVSLFNLYVFNGIGRWFQEVLLVKMENIYLKTLRRSLKGRNSVIIFVGTIILMIVTMGLYFGGNPKVLFFPENQPSYVNIMAELPIGTDIQTTNSLMLDIERKAKEILTDETEIIKSSLSNVGSGAVGENEMASTGGKPNKALLTVTFVDFEDRGGRSTSEIMKKLTDGMINKYPGVIMTLDKNSMGPPTGKAVNLEVAGKEFDQLIMQTDTIQQIIESANIAGIEGLQMNLNIGNPEVLVTIDRDKARRYGLSTGQIASTLRTSLFGKEISDYKDGEDEYPIQLRLKEEYRNDIGSLLNQKITFRNNMGKLMQVPISAVADVSFSTTYGSVRRKDMKRVITLASNVIEGYNANEVNQQIAQILEPYQPYMPEGYEYKFTGEQEDMAESMEFLSRAMMIAVALILIILVSQFNSVVRPLIIIFSVLLSTIGVFGGLFTFSMDFVVVMTGIGIVSLAGIVVNNAIVLIDYIEQLKTRKRIELDLDEEAVLEPAVARECIVIGGKTRLRPVLLTAITTILGLLPMAIGLNLDFGGFLESFSPNIYFGGDMANMWRSLSWTVIFGLTFSTFLTLIVVPVMYRLTSKLEYMFVKK